MAKYHSGDDAWLLPLPSTSSGESLPLRKPWTASCVPSVTCTCFATQNVGKFAGGRSAIKITGSPGRKRDECHFYGFPPWIRSNASTDILGNPGKTQGAGEDQRLFSTIYPMFGAFGWGHEKRLTVCTSLTILKNVEKIFVGEVAAV